MEHQEYINETNYSIDGTSINYQNDDLFFSFLDYESDFFEIEEFNDSQCLLQAQSDNCISNTSLFSESMSFNKFPKNNCQMKQKRKRNPKEKVSLYGDSEIFYQNMCYLLTNGQRKNIRKELVLEYHSKACDMNNLIRKVERNEYRSIKKYFNAFVDQQNLILQTFQKLKDKGEINYELEYRKLISKRHL